MEYKGNFRKKEEETETNYLDNVWCIILQYIIGIWREGAYHRGTSGD